MLVVYQSSARLFKSFCYCLMSSHNRGCCYCCCCCCFEDSWRALKSGKYEWEEVNRISFEENIFFSTKSEESNSSCRRETKSCLFSRFRDFENIFPVIKHAAGLFIYNIYYLNMYTLLINSIFRLN